jgi:hypothetical protein
LSIEAKQEPERAESPEPKKRKRGILEKVCKRPEPPEPPEHLLKSLGFFGSGQKIRPEPDWNLFKEF